MESKNFFQKPQNALQKKYEALRSFFLEEKTAGEIAKKFGYTLNAVYSLIRDFKNLLKDEKFPIKRFFIELKTGPKPKSTEDEAYSLMILLRKKNLSIPDIKAILDSQKADFSETYIYKALKKEGFARLPRRSVQTKQEMLSQTPIAAPKTVLFEGEKEVFNSQSIGILFFIPYILSYGIDKLIKKSSYPGTKTIPALNSILCFLALKISNVRRYTSDDLWCMDRGLGLFAGLNVLPKAAWYTSYSNGITREMNLSFLKSMSALWKEKGLLSDTANLDFVAVPYWGDDAHLENNWSGTRHQALSSILAAIAEDPDSGIITYGDTTVRHDKESQVVLEFLDFYKQSDDDLKYLVFDSKVTTYENLKRIDQKNIKFITIRRRGKSVIKELEELPKASWKIVRVPCAGGKKRQLKVFEKKLFIKDYGKELRQIAITGHGKIKPALIITNDFDLKLEDIIRKYAKRWLVEKTISEQTHFFHLNRVSSSVVIKVDFDLTMSILAHNLYRLLANDLSGYENNTAVKLYEKFIQNSGRVEIKDDITVLINKKRHNPLLLEAMEQFKKSKVPWLKNFHFQVKSDTHT